MGRLNSIKQEILDCVGKKFNHILVLEVIISAPSSGQRYFRCRCDCGSEWQVNYYKVISGHTKSCGCMKNVKHGASKRGRHTKIYNVWRNMKYRCYNPDAKYYHCYGGRGITVCDRWLNSFENFYADVNEGYKEGLTLDRINNDGNYEPGNFRWVDIKHQHKNKSTNVNITYSGKTMILADWAREFSIDERTLNSRIKKWGWPIEKALLTPPLHEPYRAKKTQKNQNILYEQTVQPNNQK